MPHPPQVMQPSSPTPDARKAFGIEDGGTTALEAAASFTHILLLQSSSATTPELTGPLENQLETLFHLVGRLQTEDPEFGRLLKLVLKKVSPFPIVVTGTGASCSQLHNPLNEWRKSRQRPSCGQHTLRGTLHRARIVCGHSSRVVASAPAHSENRSGVARIQPKIAILPAEIRNFAGNADILSEQLSVTVPVVSPQCARSAGSLKPFEVVVACWRFGSHKGGSAPSANTEYSVI